MSGADASPLEAVRAGCAEVARRAGSVRRVADDAALLGYARGLDLTRVTRPSWDETLHFRDPGDAEATAAYAITLDAINFGSGYFPELVERPGLGGYGTIALALTERFRQRGPFPARQLERLTIDRTAALFGQPLDGDGAEVRIELLAHVTQALNDLGVFLAGYDGRFLGLVEAAGGSAARLVTMLTEMPYYRDVADYDGLRVPFYKRAQITASDLALAFGGAGPGRFADLDRLTIFADDLVPHVLRVDGLLAYADALAARLARGERLEPGSADEVEIRALAVDTVERMVAALAAAGVRVTARELDIALWERGQQPRYRGPERHRTRTVFY